MRFSNCLKLDFAGFSCFFVCVNQIRRSLVIVHLDRGANGLGLLLEPVNLVIRLSELFLDCGLSRLLVLGLFQAILEISLLLAPEFDVIEEVSPELGVRDLIRHEPKLSLSQLRVHLRQYMGQENVVFQIKIEVVGELRLQLEQQVLLLRELNAVLL